MISEESLNEEFDDSIDLTPMLDVVFQLLIFFIMATTFTRPVLDVMLPASETSGLPSPGRQELLVVIDENGHVFHEGKEVPRQGLDALMELSPELPLNFHVDEHAPFEAFIAVLDKAKSKGRENFVITTRHVSAKHP